MNKNFRRLALVLGLSSVLTAGVVDAANYTKTLQATYSNIQVSYNGVVKSLSAEPFAVDGTTYLPLRALGNAIGADVNWNSDSHTVVITQDAASSSTTAAQIQQYQSQIAALTQQLATANAQLANYQSSNTTTNNSTTNGTTTNTTTSTTALANEIQTYLEDTFSDKYNISWDISVSISSSYVTVELSYSSKSDATTFGDLSEAKVKSFLTSICGNVRTYTELPIKGTIVDDYNDVTKSTFSYSKSNSLSYDLDTADYDDFAEDLLDEYDEITSIETTNGDSSASATTSTFGVDVDNIKITTSGSNLLISVYLDLDEDSSSDQNRWNYMNTNGESTMKKFGKKLISAVESEFDLDASIIYYDVDENKIGKATSSSFSRYELD